ncbi:MAG: CHASE2 domain-containing protein [Candidatus Riflebacteria bacterium]|nr:CHASE2 domain-containing protein [Candidatus Riflebacteria bacterium]
MEWWTWLSNRWNGGWFELGAWLGKRFGRPFHLAAAVVFTLLGVFDLLVYPVTDTMRLAAYDTILHYRLFPPAPDPDIVIVDIDEGSLAAMAKEFGRWPWPRQVFGEFVELVGKQNPKAIVFDILFSDPDLFNAESDAAFDAAIAGASQTFFPMLRLDPANDPLSEIKASLIPGVRTSQAGRPGTDPTIALVLPHFPAALASKRLGLHNIQTDDDGVVREYAVHRDEQGWILPSLPARIGWELGWPVPAAGRVLLNWRGPPFSYRYVRFSEVFEDLLRKEKRRPANEFAGKIVIIGSTAPSLFDFKPTPMSLTHPGVEILATAIDNVKHGDFLRFPGWHVPYFLLAMAIIWWTAWKLYRATNPVLLDWWFGLSQTALVGCSYASINLGTTYINLTCPVSLALGYFGVVRSYASLTAKALDPSMVRRAGREEGTRQAAVLLIRIDTEEISDYGWALLRAGLLRAGTEDKSIELIDGNQRGVWDLFEKTFAVCWMAPREDPTARARFEADAQAVVTAFPGLRRQVFTGADEASAWFLHHGVISCGEAAEGSWRRFVAEAVLQWEGSREAKGNA